MAAMIWEPVLDNSGVIDMGYSQVAGYRLPGGDYVLIDSGLQEEPALISAVQAEGRRVRAVICTHLHIDHVANNYLLHKTFGTEIFASVPVIEEALRTGRQLAPEGCPPPPMTPYEAEDGELTIDGTVFPVLSTPGHCEGHMAVVTPDGLCCLGDCVLTADKAWSLKLPYLEDVDRSLETMERFRSSPWPLYQLSHKGVLRQEEMGAAIDANIEKELYLQRLLRQLMDHPMSYEELYAVFFPHERIRDMPPHQHWLRKTLNHRIDALVKCGDAILHDGLIVPN